MKVTLTRVSRKEKEGPKGPFISVGIQTKEHGDRWLNGYENKANSEWKAGDVVNIEVEEKGQWLNFKMPKAVAGDTSGIEKKVDDLTVLCLRIYECVKPKKTDDMPEF